MYLASKSENSLVDNGNSLSKEFNSTTLCFCILTADKGAAIAIVSSKASFASSLTLRLCSVVLFGLATHASPFQLDVYSLVKTKADIFKNVVPSAYTSFFELISACCFAKPTLLSTPYTLSDVIAIPASSLSNKLTCSSFNKPIPNHIYLNAFVVMYI